MVGRGSARAGSPAPLAVQGPCRTSTRKAAQDPIRLSLVIAYTIHEQVAARFHARDCSVLVLPDRTAAVLLREIFRSNIHDSSAGLLLSIDRFLHPGQPDRKSV